MQIYSHNFCDDFSKGHRTQKLQWWWMHRLGLLCKLSLFLSLSFTRITRSSRVGVNYCSFFLYSPLNDVSFDVRKQHLQSSNLHADAFFKFRHLVYEARIADVFRLERKSKRNYGSVLAWCMMDWCIMVTKLLSIHYRQASGF